MNAKRLTELDFSNVEDRPRTKKVNVPTPKVAKPRRFVPAELGEQPPAPDQIIIPDVTGMTVRQAALAYAKAGIYVVPVKRGTKDPSSLLGKWADKSSTDSKVIEGWFKKWPNANVGIHPGKSGLLVFDLDKADDLASLPEDIADALRPAAFQRSRVGARGHYVFADPVGTGNSAGGWAPWGDVRGANGFIMAAPSIHPETGKRYEWVRTGEVPHVPIQLRDLIGTSVLDVYDALSDADLEAFLGKYTLENDVTALDKMVGAFKVRVDQGESRHTAMQGVLVGAMRDASAGLYSAQLAYDTLKAVYDEAFHEPGSRRPNTGEFHAMVQWAANQPDADEVAAELWEMSEELEAIHEAGIRWGVPPMTLLAEGLLRALIAIPPNWYLPGIVGTPAPPNLFLARVGHSGQGKNNSENLASMIFRYDDATRLDIIRGTPASGEAIATMFGRRGQPKVRSKDESEEAVHVTGYLHTRVFARFGEIGLLVKASARQGSTLTDTMLDIWSGAQFGRNVADGTKGNTIETNRYRVVLSVGGQPTRVSELLAQRDSGLPQRFLWVTTVDPNAVLATNQPGDKPPIIRLPSWKFNPEAWGARMGTPVEEHEMNVFTVPEQVRAQVKEANLVVRKIGLEDEASMLSHQLLLMEKVALAFAVLHGETKGFDMKHWEMAERFVRHGEALVTRLRVLSARGRKEGRIIKAKQEGEALAIAKQQEEKTVIEEVRTKVIKHLTEQVKAKGAGAWMTGGALSQQCSKRQREFLPQVLTDLHKEKKVQKRATKSTPPGAAYRLPPP